MALDTAQKRAAATGDLLPFPDGSVEVQDRAQLLGLYTFIVGSSPGDLPQLPDNVPEPVFKRYSNYYTSDRGAMRLQLNRLVRSFRYLALKLDADGGVTDADFFDALYAEGGDDVPREVL